MVLTGPTFNCIVICPSGKLLDCQTISVVFPSHDGQVGIMANHIPMFCTLGLGIMLVRTISPDLTDKGTISLVVDGGFAVFCKNLLKVVSYDVIIPSNMEPQAIEQSYANLQRRLRPKVGPEEREHIVRKLALLRQFM